MASSDSYYVRLLPAISLYLNQYGTILAYVVGNLGNLSSIFIFCQKSWRKNVCSFYFVVCLLCCTFFINTSILATIITTNSESSVYNSSNAFCKIFFYIAYLFSVYYPTTLILASIDRLLMSSRNVDVRLYSSKRLAYFSLTGGMLFWSLFLLHILIKAGIQEVYPTVFVCYYEMSNFYLDFFSYSSLVITMSVPLIMIVLSILALKNVRRIRAVPRQQRKEIRSMTKKDFQLLRCLYMHNIVYIIFSILVAFSIAYSRFVKFQAYSPINQAIETFLSNLGTFSHYIPYCSSFFISVSMSRAFRQELKRCAYRLLRKDLTATARGDEEINPAVVARDVAVSTVDLR